MYRRADLNCRPPSGGYELVALRNKKSPANAEDVKVVPEAGRLSNQIVLDFIDFSKIILNN